jgi:PD-(D/E)XK nuclease superfamily
MSAGMGLKKSSAVGRNDLCRHQPPIVRPAATKRSKPGSASGRLPVDPPIGARPIHRKQVSLQYEVHEEPRRFTEKESGSSRCRPLPLGFRADIPADATVILAIKAVPALLPAHDMQRPSCLRMSGLPAGLQLNFHALRLKDSLRCFAG